MSVISVMLIRSIAEGSEWISEKELAVHYERILSGSIEDDDAKIFKDSVSFFFFICEDLETFSEDLQCVSFSESEDSTIKENVKNIVQH